MNLLGYGPALGKFVKVNDTWLEVVGVPGEQPQAGAHSPRGQMEDVKQHRLCRVQHLAQVAGQP